MEGVYSTSVQAKVGKAPRCAESGDHDAVFEHLFFGGHAEPPHTIVHFDEAVLRIGHAIRNHTQRRTITLTVPLNCY